MTFEQMRLIFTKSGLQVSFVRKRHIQRPNVYLLYLKKMSIFQNLQNIAIYDCLCATIQIHLLRNCQLKDENEEDEDDVLLALETMCYEVAHRSTSSHQDDGLLAKTMCYFARCATK